ncbi:GSCFA family protein [Aliiruegeria haliotis]|uniref:GSCFA family protein n=1 Tax=Aliiruegeria haliotis TaxID=1280846 RepID=A0A2T0RVM5_9RHOB|nr:GSCFA domain-containing protein [Aliiruegeria haliotis]PRY25231.1 GSCFA family protein [Aliiruegeria haliotis]
MTETNLERLSALDAFRRASGNPLRRYPSPEKDGDRLYPQATPACRPSFSMSPRDSVFTIGSCFARNVETALIGADVNVVSRDFDLGDVGESLGFAANFFNKYSVHSVTNELTWALERESFPGERILYPLSKGKARYCDLQLGSAKLDFSLEEILAFRHRYLDVMARAATADVVIVTLGYVECWFDTELDIYLNVAPPLPLCKAYPDRFEFRVLSYEDVLGGLRDLYAVLTRHRATPLRMLLTVSPVPLLSTLRDMDVLVANAYSKSVQRAAIDAFLAESEGVDYFPSYEFVVLSNPNAAWSRGDYRHVSPGLVKRIMDTVLDSYVEGGAPMQEPGEDDQGGEMSAEELSGAARLLLQLKEFADALALLDQHPDFVSGNAKLIQMRASALSGVGRLEEAFELMGQADTLAPQHPAPLERRISWCRRLRRPEQRRLLMAEHARRFPDRGDFRTRHGGEA